MSDDNILTYTGKDGVKYVNQSIRTPHRPTVATF